LIIQIIFDLSKQIKMKNKLAAMIDCFECHGTGIKNHYMHIANGVCFKCKGTGKLKKAAEKSISFANRFILQYDGKQPGMVDCYFPADQSKMTVVQIIGNHGHATAEWKVMKDDLFFYVGQPICRGSRWYKIPAENFMEFVKYFNRAYKSYQIDYDQKTHTQKVSQRPA
jgi:hypothetical protein